MNMDDAFSPRKKVYRGFHTRRSRFSPEEDELLKSLVVKHGDSDWKLIASKMNKRNERQVRDRWRIWLDPNVNREPFTGDEDELIRELYESFGPKWVMFTKYFNKRTDVALKCRWKSMNRMSDRGRKAKQEKKQDTEHEQRPETDMAIFDQFWNRNEEVDLQEFFPYF